MATMGIHEVPAGIGIMPPPAPGLPPPPPPPPDAPAPPPVAPVHAQRHTEFFNLGEDEMPDGEKKHVLKARSAMKAVLKPGPNAAASPSKWNATKRRASWLPRAQSSLQVLK